MFCVYKIYLLALSSLITTNVAYLNLSGRDKVKPAISCSSRYAGTVAKDTGIATELYPKVGKGTQPEKCTQ